MNTAAPEVLDAIRLLNDIWERPATWAQYAEGYFDPQLAHMYWHRVYGKKCPDTKSAYLDKLVCVERDKDRQRFFADMKKVMGQMHAVFAAFGKTIPTVQLRSDEKACYLDTTVGGDVVPVQITKHEWHALAALGLPQEG